MILPDRVLYQIVAHVVGIGQHSETLLAAGQHLKRGVLLYGPPGTGKTHIIRHLITRTPGTTVVLLSGRTLPYSASPPSSLGPRNPRSSCSRTAT